jgi:outer membrane protein assembly factor BamD
MRRLLRLGLLLGLALPALGCAPEQPADSPLKYTENARRAYDEALEIFFDRDWEQAIAAMEEVRRQYAYSRYARLAQLRIGDAHYHQDQFPEAVTAYKEFVHDYPNDAEIPYAQYKIAKALYEQASPSLLLPPLEERDLASVHDAYKTIRDFLEEYPNYSKVRELEHMLDVVTGLLARHELYVARYYLDRDNFKAAAFRAEYALKTYEFSGLEPEGMVLLGEIYLRMHQREKARAAFQQVLARYPDSAFTLPAREFLKRLAAASTVDVRAQ